LGEHHFARTRTGKVDRKQLVAGYEQGTWSTVSNTLAEPASTPVESHSSLARISNRWCQVLGLEADSRSSAGFFDLGGDSLKFAEMIVTIEDEFGVQIPIQRFFENPVLSNLVALVDEARANDAESLGPGSGVVSVRQLMRRSETMLVTWNGDRLSDASLMVGANTTGTRIPVIWVCQSNHEFRTLAEALGPDQPLYGLRSLDRLVEIDELTSEILDTVSYRYLAEILSLHLDEPLVIGGNCSGAIIALAVARKARQFGSEPHPLVLLNWMFSFGRYDGPVVLLQGMDDSATFALKDWTDRPIDWRSDFPAAGPQAIPGGHGKYFGGESLKAFAAKLREHTSAPSDTAEKSAPNSDLRHDSQSLPQTTLSLARRLVSSIKRHRRLR